MGDHEKDPDLHPDFGEQLRRLREYVARADRIINLVVSKSMGKIKHPEGAGNLMATIGTLQTAQEESRSGLEALSEYWRVSWLEKQQGATLGVLIDVMIWTDTAPSEERQGDQRGNDADVLDQLREKAPRFESNLYFLFTWFFESHLRKQKEEVNFYEDFKSSLERLVKDSENQTVLGILDLMTAFEKKFVYDRFWNSKGKKERGGREDILLEQFLNNIQLVAFLVDQSGRTEPDDSSLADFIEECEEEQKEMESSIRALKN